MACHHQMFEETDQKQPYALDERISTFVIIGLETQNGDDEPRSEALRSIVKQAVLKTGMCSVRPLKRVLQSLSSSDVLK
jgi:hypothetical protein